jgi:hypothetical protein
MFHGEELERQSLVRIYFSAKLILSAHQLKLDFRIATLHLRATSSTTASASIKVGLWQCKARTKD